MHVDLQSLKTAKNRRRGDGYGPVVQPGMPESDEGFGLKNVRFAWASTARDDRKAAGSNPARSTIDSADDSISIRSLLEDCN